MHAAHMLVKAGILRMSSAWPDRLQDLTNMVKFSSIWSTQFDHSFEAKISQIFANFRRPLAGPVPAAAARAPPANYLANDISIKIEGVDLDADIRKVYSLHMIRSKNQIVSASSGLPFFAEGSFCS